MLFTRHPLTTPQLHDGFPYNYNLQYIYSDHDYSNMDDIDVGNLCSKHLAKTGTQF